MTKYKSTDPLDEWREASLAGAKDIWDTPEDEALWGGEKTDRIALQSSRETLLKR